MSSDARAVPAAPSAVASAANSSDADAHFPVLSQSAAPPSVSRAYSSSALAAHSFPPISSNNPGAAASVGVSSSSRWPSSSRNPVTAADVVAARPPDLSAQSVEEEMAKKEKNQLAFYAQLVPKTSSIPRAPGRSLGRGGLRATGSVAGQQQQRNAASNARSPNNAILPAPTSRARKEHSSNRLTSLTSDATKPQLARRIAPASSKPKALQLPPGMMSLANQSGVENTEKSVKLSDAQAADELKPKFDRDSVRKEDKLPSSVLNNGLSMSVPTKAPLTGPSLRPGGTASSFRVAAAGLAARTAAASKVSSRVTLGLSKSGIDPALSVSKPTIEIPSSQGNSPETPLSPKALSPPIADAEVMEQRRKAFASSPDAKPAKGRSSYHSSRKSLQNSGRRLSHSSSLTTQIGNGTSSQSKSGGPRIDYVSTNGFSSRVAPGNGRAKVPNGKPEPQVNGADKDAGFKNSYPDRDGTRGPVLPINSRAEALRDAIGASSKKNGFRSDARKIGGNGKDLNSVSKPVSRRSVPSIGSGELGKDSLSSSNGLRSRGSRIRAPVERKPKSVSIPHLVRRQDPSFSSVPANPGINLPQSILAKEPESRPDPVLSPREQIEEDFPARQIPFLPREALEMPSTSIPIPVPMPLPKSAPVVDHFDDYMHQYIDDIPRQISELMDIELRRIPGNQEPYMRSAIDNNYPVPDFQEKLISWMDNEVKDPPSTPNLAGLHHDFGSMETARRVQRIQGQRDKSAISMIDLMNYIHSRAQTQQPSSFRSMSTEQAANEHFDEMIRRLLDEPQVNGVNESRSGASSMPINFADEDVSALNTNGNSGGVAGPVKAVPSSLFYSPFS